MQGPAGPPAAPQARRQPPPQKHGTYKGIVESDYEYDADRTDEYSNVRKVNWTNKGDWTINHQSPQKTLTDITPYSDFVQEIKALFEEDDIADDEQEIAYPEYTAENFLDDVYMSEDNYTRLVGLLRNKKNIILQGAPGVGKTYAAKRLAYSMMGVKDVERVMMVQFHQSYSYEDFIMGFRPSATGFELKKGAFYNFCKKAEVNRIRSSSSAILVRTGRSAQRACGNSRPTAAGTGTAVLVNS